MESLKLRENRNIPSRQTVVPVGCKREGFGLTDILLGGACGIGGRHTETEVEPVAEESQELSRLSSYLLLDSVIPMSIASELVNPP